MRVYDLSGNHDFRAFALTDTSQWDLFDEFDGTPIECAWKPPRIKFIKDDPDWRTLPMGDCPYFTPGTPVLSKRATEALEDILAATGQLFPFRFDEGEYYAFNVTCLLDALDEELSDCERYVCSGRIMRVRRFVFRRECLQGATIFKIPQLARGWVFLTDTVVERIQAAGLTGFNFKLLWSDSEI